MHLYLIRHGQTHSNLDLRYQGRSDSHLTPLGEQQAESLARWLHQENNTGSHRIVTSTLGRARKTGHILSGQLGALDMLELEDLVEIGLGPFEGLTFDEADEKYPTARRAFKETPTLGEFLDGAETYEAARARAARALDLVRDRDVDRVYVVTHGGFLGILVNQLLDLPIQRPVLFRTSNTAVSRFHLTPTHCRIHYVNSLTHLESDENQESRFRSGA